LTIDDWQLLQSWDSRQIGVHLDGRQVWKRGKTNRRKRRRVGRVGEIFSGKEVNEMPSREEILRAVAQVAPDRVDAVAALLPQTAPTRRRKSGTLVRHERDEALAEEFHRQQALRKAVRELERRELQQRENERVTIFVYDERMRFRKIPAPTQRHPVPSILSGKVRAGKARVVRYIIELDAESNLRVFNWSALMRKRTI
jgi:hypothetical protein